MYPIQPLPPLVDISHGGGASLGRFANAALLTSTRVSDDFVYHFIDLRTFIE
jgi:hypothetical protein